MQYFSLYCPSKAANFVCLAGTEHDPMALPTLHHVFCLSLVSRKFQSKNMFNQRNVKTKETVRGD